MRTAVLLAIAAVLAAAAPAAAAPTLVKVGDFDAPTYVTSPPNDPRLFVVEQPGRVKVLSGGTTKTFLDVTSITENDGSEEGLLSIAFPPDYAASGRFYAYLVAEGGESLRIVEFRRSADPDVADPATARDVIPPIPHTGQRNHNGGQLQFGPDGRLWIGTGDGGGSNDPGHNAQDPASQLGKLLRVDPLTGGAETFARGLRNPWRFSFDRQTGDLVVGDVGQDAREEIDFIPAPTWQPGANYGWPCFEGTRDNSGDTTDPACASLTGDLKPTLEQPQSAGFSSITGGYVVRDPGLPTLAGRYLYGDIAKDRLRSVVLAPGSATGDREEASLSVAVVVAFGEDACGRVYAASQAPGAVYRIEDGAPTPCAPTGGPPGGGGGPAPVADTTKPRLAVRVRGAKTLPTRRRLRVALQTDELTAATLTGRARGVARFKTVRRQLKADTRRVVELRITKKAARKLRRTLRRKAVRVTVSVRVRDAAGNQRAARRNLKLERRR